MKKDELINKIKSTVSVVEFYKLKVNILEALEGHETKKKPEKGGLE